MRKFLNQVGQSARNTVDSTRNAFRGVLNLVKSNLGIQQVQVSGLADETLQDVELVQHFGFTSSPPKGCEAVILPVGGRTTHSIVVATEHADFRVKALKSGEVAIYDQSGSSVVLKHGKIIEIQCDQLIINATQKVEINTPLTQVSKVLTAKGQINGQGGMAVQGGSGASFSGNVQQTSGSFTTTGDVKAGAISLKNHKHNGDSGGVTGTPK